MKAIFEAINNIFSFVTPVSDFLWDFPKNFEVEFKDNNLTFTAYGYGHGVGMSQNGANYMAQQGSDYKEILLHYYKDCEIKTIQ